MFKEQQHRIAGDRQAQQTVQKISTVLSGHSISSNKLIHRYTWATQGFAAHLTPAQVKMLRQDPRIEYVVKDYFYQPFATTANASASKSKPSSANKINATGQITPWGVSRIYGPFDGTGTTAWVIGTGVDFEHDDLNVDTLRSATFTNEPSADDQHGHGTYVAGIIAAIDNDEDIVGVAAGATVVAVSVCSPNGCWASDVKAGVEYVAAHFNPGDVANMSIGFPVNDCNRCDIPLSDLEASVISAANAGLLFTMAAGNDANNAGNYSPGRLNHQNIYTVSAFRQGDEFVQDFDCITNHKGSNYGNPPIDYSAPGEDIPSLRIGGDSGMGYRPNYDCSNDGTSYAAPHVAGLLLATPTDVAVWDYVTGDPDGNPDPIAINPPLTVYITGDALLKSGETGTWTATVYHDTGPVTYQWYKQPVNSNNWFPPLGGDHDSQYSAAFYNGTSSAQYAKIKVVVNSNGETANDFVWVGVSSEDCEDENAANNNSTTPSLLPPPCSW